MCGHNTTSQPTSTRKRGRLTQLHVKVGPAGPGCVANQLQHEDIGQLGSQHRGQQAPLHP